MRPPTELLYVKWSYVGIWGCFKHYSYIIWSRWVPDQLWLATWDDNISPVGFKCFYVHVHVVVRHLIATWSKKCVFLRSYCRLLAGENLSQTSINHCFFTITGNLPTTISFYSICSPDHAAVMHCFSFCFHDWPVFADLFFLFTCFRVNRLIHKDISTLLLNEESKKPRWHMTYFVQSFRLNLRDEALCMITWTCLWISTNVTAVLNAGSSCGVVTFLFRHVHAASVIWLRYRQLV